MKAFTSYSRVLYILLVDRSSEILSLQPCGAGFGLAFEDFSMSNLTRRELLRATGVSGLALSASSILAGSAWAGTQALAADAPPILAPRERLPEDCRR